MFHKRSCLDGTNKLIQVVSAAGKLHNSTFQLPFHIMEGKITLRCPASLVLEVHEKLNFLVVMGPPTDPCAYLDSSTVAFPRLSSIRTFKFAAPHRNPRPRAQSLGRCGAQAHQSYHARLPRQRPYRPLSVQRAGLNDPGVWCATRQLRGQRLHRHEQFLNLRLDS